MKLRARWKGDLPRVGDVLSSAHPRYWYVINAVRELSPGRLVLTCERIAVNSSLPRGARVHPWTWDRRGSRASGKPSELSLLRHP